MSEKYLPTYEGCLVCGHPHVNPSTLNRRFKVTDDGVEVNFKADFRQAGYKGIVHGGITTALLDETIGWAIAVEKKMMFMTAELNVRFIRPLPVGLDVTVRGRATEHKSRYSMAEGEIVDADGHIYAKATGKFFLMKDWQAEEINNQLTFQENDLDIFAE